MRSHHPRLFLTAAIAVCALAPYQAGAAAPVVEYLYIEANEGGSSGGHAALRLDDAVYHFQHQAPGVIRLQRDGADHFASYYTGLQNRTIHASRIETSADTYTLLRDYFARVYLVQQKQFEILSARDDDVRLLQALRHPSEIAPTTAAADFPLRGAGFFYATILPTRPERSAGTEARATQISSISQASGWGGPPCPPAFGTTPDESPGGIERLRAQIFAIYGADAIRQRRAELYAELRRLRPANGVDPSATLAEDVYPNAMPTFSQRYRDTLLGIVALQVLEEAPPLRADTYRAPVDDEFRLTAGEQRALQSYAATSARDLAPLLRSQRPDWGFALLVGMARLRALDATAASGSLIFLDSFPPDAEVISRADIDRNAAAMPVLLAAAHAELGAARTALESGQAIDEVTYTQVEAAANRFLELSNAANHGATLRVHAGALVPAKAAAGELVSPELTAEELDAGLDSSMRQRDAYRGRLNQFYGYHLLTKNCVSEIFRYLNAALAPAGPSIVASSTAHLGGHIEPGEELSFIPFVSADAVRRRYHVSETETLESYRTRAVNAMYLHEDDLVVFLRESNAVTSTVYRRNPRDSYFLFFTDDSIATRPVFGMVNLLAGVGAGTVGLALAPFDGGQLLKRGLKGALFSLPELAFFNIRKGTFDYVAGDDGIAGAS